MHTRLTPLLLALPLLLLPLAPPAAASPAARCQKATARGLAACVGAASKAELRCFRKTGAACPADERRRTKALAKLEKQVGRRCPDALVAEAGYAPLPGGALVAHLQEACAAEVDGLSLRIFGGPDGDLLASASPDDASCLLRAGKEAGALLARALKTVGRCAGRSCQPSQLDRADAALAKHGEKAASRLTRRCDDLESLVGLDPAALATETLRRTASAAASPCDPLDPGHCFFPFSNDYFSRIDPGAASGRRLRLSADTMPRNLAGDPVDTSKWNELDGFSVGPVLIFQGEAADLELSGVTPITDVATSLEADAAVTILDAETGEAQLLWAERDVQNAAPEDRPILVRVGANLENGRRYLVAVRGLRDASGDALAAPPVFAAYRDRVPTAQLPVEARRAHMEALFAELEGFGVARDELYLAWDFTTQSTESTSRRLLAMRDDAFGNVLGAAAPEFTVDTVTEPLNADIFRRIDGTFQAPLYLTDGGAPGSLLRVGPDGLPLNQGDFFTASYRCVVPYAATTGGAAPAVPARVALYGHGLLGSANETGASHVRALAHEHNFIVCGTDWTGFAEDDLPTVFSTLIDFSNFPKFIERQHQGVLDFMVLGRLLLHADGFASHPAFQVDGESLIDPSGLFYDGNSQGGILGGVLAAFSQDIERFVLGVPGINYSTLLERSTDFILFDDILTGNYPDALDRFVLIATAQILWDQTDPSGHVRHTTADPYPNTPAKKILYHVAFGDHQVAPVTAEVAARSNGAHLHTPALEPGKVVPELTPYYGIPAVPAYPWDGSALVIWDSGNPAPPIGNEPPPEIGDMDPEWPSLSPCAQDFDSDPHECPRRQPEARTQKSEFLRNDGAVIDVCGGLACLAPSS